jgi:hypothetical protein
MRALSLLFMSLSIAGCDRISQRVWNCSTVNLDVLKISEPNFEIVETIPARSWIASMKGGVQITKITVADGRRAKILWHHGQSVLTSRSNSADDICAGRTSGVVIQQF